MTNRVSYDFTGAAVVVTGGTGGLGNRICRRFASQGARVAVVYLSRVAVAQQLAAELLAEGASASLAIQADVVIEDQAVAPVYPPLPKSRLDLVAAWDEPLSFRRPGLRRVAS